MVLLVNAAELAKPYILEVVIDRYLTAGRPDQGLDAVWVLALGYMACVALSSVLNVSEAVMVNRMGQSILMDIRRRVFNHIQHMSMKTLDHFSSPARPMMSRRSTSSSRTCWSTCSRTCSCCWASL